MSECKYYQELISRMLDKDLSKRERAAVMEHLDSCPECAAMYEAFSMLSNNVSANLVDPPEELTEDIMANIRRSEVIRKNRKTSRQLKTIIAAAACVAVLVAVVGGFSVIKNLRKENVVYTKPQLSESNIVVDPASGSTAADGMTESSVAGTNTNSNLPPIQFGETVVSSSASVQPGQTTLPDFPSAPEQNNTWYGNNSQPSYNTQQSYGNTQQSVQVPQQQVQVPQQQTQQVQVQQPGSGKVVVLQPGPGSAQGSDTLTVIPAPTPTPEPTNSLTSVFPFLSFLKPQQSEPTPTPYVEPTPTPTPYVEPEPTPTPYVEPEPTPTPYVEPEPVYTEPVYTEPEPVYTEPVYTEPEPVYTEPTYTEPEPVIVGDPLMEQPPVEEEPAPVEEPAAEEPVIDSREPVRIDLTDKDTDSFIAALLGIKEEAAAPVEELPFADGTEAVPGELPEGEGYVEESIPAAEPTPVPWEEVLPEDTEADRTDILLYRHQGEDCELEVRLYGNDVYLLYDNENAVRICTPAEYNADTYKLALDTFLSGDSDAAVRTLTEQ